VERSGVKRENGEKLMGILEREKRAMRM